MPAQRRIRIRLIAAGLVLVVGAVLVWPGADRDAALLRSAGVGQQATGNAPATVAVESEARPSFLESVRAVLARPAATPEQSEGDRDEYLTEFRYLIAIPPPELPEDNQRVAGAYEATYSAFLDTLRALPGLALLELESADQDIDAVPVDFQLEVTGAIDPSVDPDWSFTVHWTATRNGEGWVTETQLQSNLRPIEELGIDAARQLQRFPFPPGDTWLPELVARVLDDALSDEERIAAIDELQDIPRRFEFIGIDAGHTAAVAAVEIVANAADADIRSRAWRAMIDAGVDDPYLIGPLVDSLLQDPDETMRSHAAKLLVRKFADDQRVLAALDYAISNDASPRVTALAKWEFLDETGRRAYVQSTLLNDDLAVTERFDILVADLADLHAYLDPQTALFALSRAADNIDQQRNAATRLDRESIDYQRMVPMLIGVLGENENVQLRITAALMLSRYADDPIVRAALERAAANDRSSNLRYQLIRMLRR